MCENLTIVNRKLLRYTGTGERVVIPEGVDYIGDRAFEDCRTLREVVFPEGLLEIGDEAFSGCCLERVDLPDSLLLLGLYAFDMDLPFTISVPETCICMVQNEYDSGYEVEIRSRNPETPDFIIRDKTLLAYLGQEETVQIPQGVETIGAHAFLFREDPVYLIVPDSVTKISSMAFYHTCLQHISLPAHLQYCLLSLPRGCQTSCRKRT